MLAGACYALSAPLVSLVLDREGAATWIIGLVATMGGVSVLVAAPIMPRLANRIGGPWLLTLGVALMILSTLGTAWSQGPLPWAAWRFILGAGIGLHWITSEAWLSHIATPGRRGRLLALYVASVVTGFALGPLIVGVVGADTALPFQIAVGLAVACALPLPFLRGTAPSFPTGGQTGLFRIARHLPLSVTASFLCGVLEAGATALLPVYAGEAGYGRPGALLGLAISDLAALWLVVFMIGNLALQAPAAYAADRIDPRVALAACGVLVGISALAVPGVGGGILLWAALFFWGGAAFALYTISLANVGRRAAPRDLAAANAGFVLAYQLGAMAGPALLSAAMSVAGPHALPFGLGAAALLFALFAAWRWRTAAR